MKRWVGLVLMAMLVSAPVALMSACGDVVSRVDNKFKAGDTVFDKDGDEAVVVSVPGDKEYDRLTFLNPTEGLMH